MQKITPFLWFNDNADEAIKFYVSVFKNSKLVNASYYGDAGPGPKGTIMTATIELEGQRFMLLNGGPMFKFTEAISLFISCKTQEEVDYYWDKLIEGGQPSQCGWLKDKFGLSWQVVPEILGELIRGKDAKRANNAMQAMLENVKTRYKEVERGIRKVRRSVSICETGRYDKFPDDPKRPLRDYNLISIIAAIISMPSRKFLMRIFSFSAC